jgi:hypothetical protein
MKRISLTLLIAAASIAAYTQTAADKETVNNAVTSFLTSWKNHDFMTSTGLALSVHYGMGRRMCKVPLLVCTSHFSRILLLQKKAGMFVLWHPL